MKSLFATLLGTTLIVTGAATTFIAPAQANPNKPEAPKPDNTKPENDKPDNTKPENDKPDNTKPENDKPAASTTCNLNDVSLLTPVKPSATACAGPIAGNDTGGSTFLDDLNDGDYFADILGSGLTWSLLGKSDTSNDTVFGQNNQSTGSFNFTTTSPIDKFIITLKAGDAFSAYLFNNLSAATQFVGQFNTIGVEKDGSGNAGRDLSHLSVFVASGNVVVDPEPVPEPASLLGIGLMAGGMVAARRRKAK